MKKRINIGFSSMAGMGPAAWDSDHEVLAIHTPHHESDKKTEQPDDEKRRLKEDKTSSSDTQI